MKKNEIPKVVVEEDGTFECPECGGLGTLDSYEFTQLTTKGKLIYYCPLCETKLKLLSYEQDSDTEL